MEDSTKPARIFVPAPTVDSMEKVPPVSSAFSLNIGIPNPTLRVVRVVVGMGTCGISAGARPVMMEFVEEIKRRGVQDAMVTQTGCIGVCRLEPMVEVYMPGQEKVTYVLMTPEKVARVVGEHLINGKPVTEYTIGAVE